MTRPIEISVVIPAYNEEKALPAALISLRKSIDHLQKQVDVGVEVIVVDNLSTDQTKAVAQKLGARVLDCTTRNISAVLNMGYREANGKIICRLDSDHEMTENMLLEVWKAMQAVDVVGGGTWVDMQTDRPWMRKGAALVQFFFKVQGISLGFVFTTKQAFLDIGGYREDLLVCEDSTFTFDFRDHGRKLKQKFVNLKNAHIITQDRKRDMGFLGHLQLYSTIFFFRKTSKKKSKLKYWYEVNR